MPSAESQGRGGGGGGIKPSEMLRLLWLTSTGSADEGVGPEPGRIGVGVVSAIKGRLRICEGRGGRCTGTLWSDL